eukprot:COSAG01_NODE_69877_length_260_cov_0.639752_1_plen_74_part_01
MLRAAGSFPLFLGQTSKGNKRGRLLREMAMHTRSSLAGGAMGLCMDYFEPVRACFPALLLLPTGTADLRVGRAD